MIFLLSPAKTLDFESEHVSVEPTQPDFLKHSAELISEIKELSSKEISSLMSLSEKLSDLNHQRYQDWTKAHKVSASCRPSLLAFKGDVYQGLDAASWKKSDFTHAQKHLRILSGLYGILKPLDLMKAYRLEMGTKFQNQRGKNLYEFWGTILTDFLNKELESMKNPAIINLASNEYFSAIQKKNLTATVINPIFKDFKTDKYKIISFYAKKARGSMASWAIKNRIKSSAELTNFNEDGYRFDKKSSSETDLVFLRKQ